MTTRGQTSPRVLWLRGTAETGPGCLGVDAGLADVTEVGDIEAALDALRSRSFDLVVSQVGDFLPLERAAAAQQAQLILQNIRQGVCILALDGRALWSNARMQSLPPALMGELGVACREFARDPRSPSASDPDEWAGPTCCIVTPDAQSFEVHFTPVTDRGGKATQIAAVVSDATPQRRLQQKLDAIDRAGRELVGLEGRALARMSVAQRLEFIEERIVQFARDLLRFDNIAVHLIDAESKKLELVVGAGLTGAGESAVLYAEPEGSGISGYVASVGKSYICDDVSADPLYVEGIAQARSSLTVPLRFQDEVIGTLNVESVRPAAFGDADRQFVEIFGRYVAIALNILDLLAVERHAVTGQIAEDVSTEIAEPLNDILTEATALMDEYVGHADMRERLQAICQSVGQIRASVKQVATPAGGLLGARDDKPKHDPALADKRILVVDDEQTIRECVEALLRQRGCRVVLANDASEAVDRLAEDDYDLVLSDIRMPSGSGYEVFRAAKARRADLPVVLMTAFGYDPTHSIVRARQEGLAGALFKPFKTAELLGTLREALAPWAQPETE